MIISHKHKYIFIKTQKTAGTSLEIALSEFCGDWDIITSIDPRSERIRQGLGYRGPQNYTVPWPKWSAKEWAALLLLRRKPCFYNHAGAQFIRDRIDESIWNGYYKFCFERNPWDKAVSWYYWLTRSGPAPTLSEFIQSGAANTIMGFELYTISGEIVVDRVYLYE
jgi:hypothetical protein